MSSTGSRAKRGRHRTCVKCAAAHYMQRAPQWQWLQSLLFTFRIHFCGFVRMLLVFYFYYFACCIRPKGMMSDWGFFFLILRSHLHYRSRLDKLFWGPCCDSLENPFLCVCKLQWLTKMVVHSCVGIFFRFMNWNESMK